MLNAADANRQMWNQYRIASAYTVEQARAHALRAPLASQAAAPHAGDCPAAGHRRIDLGSTHDLRDNTHRLAANTCDYLRIPAQKYNTPIAVMGSNNHL
jgi:hypothetical protein